MTTILTPAQADYIGLPPRPLIPQQRIVNPDGTPTFEYNLFLTTQYEWERRLIAVCTGVPYPRETATVLPPSLERQWTRHGRVTAAGAITAPSVYTAAKTATGKYRITSPEDLPAGCRVVLTAEEAAGAPRYAVFMTKAAKTFDVWTYNGAGALTDSAFAFLLIAPE